MTKEVLSAMDREAVLRAVEHLRSGDVVGLPTETVYGLAADGLQPSAVAKIFSIKGRPSAHPLILHVASVAELERYAVEVPGAALRLAEQFWPGPLTIIFRRSSRVPNIVTGGLDTVAIRVPRHPVALAVLRELGRPLAAPSANRFGHVSPTTRQHVLDDLGADVPLVLEGGACEVGVESTIVDLSREVPYLLRPGAVTPAQMWTRAGVEVLADDEKGPPAPGTLASHYAPDAAVLLVAEPELWSEAIARGRLGQVGVLTTEPPPGGLPSGVLVEYVQGGVRALAHELYSALRRLDRAGCGIILTTMPAREELGLAVGDRLARASGPR